jgi:hypothetical protein
MCQLSDVLAHFRVCVFLETVVQYASRQKEVYIALVKYARMM